MLFNCDEGCGEKRGAEGANDSNREHVCFQHVCIWTFPGSGVDQLIRGPFECTNEVEKDRRANVAGKYQHLYLGPKQELCPVSFGALFSPGWIWLGREHKVHAKVCLGTDLHHHEHDI